LHLLEHACDGAEGVGHREHAQRMPAGRGVDHHQIVAVRRCESHDLEQRGELVDAGERQAEQARDVLLVEPRAPDRDALERGATRLDPAFERAVRVNRHRIEDAAADRNSGGFGSNDSGQRVAQ
jgi:hypothetical protein